jgi:predicted ATPase with chaperone activity
MMVARNEQELETYRPEAQEVAGYYARWDMRYEGRRSKPDAGGDIVLCMTQLNLSARAYHRILKLARTIADLAGCEEIQSVHLEALQYCPKLMMG